MSYSDSQYPDFADTKASWNYWYPKVYSYFYRRVSAPDVVEELTTQTMNTVFMTKDIKNPPAFIWKVAHNYLLKYFHTKTTTAMIVGWDESLDLNHNYQPQFAIEEDLENLVCTNYQTKINLLMECIQNNLDKSEDREIVRYSIQEEKNSTEIATLLNLKAGTVRQKLARTLSKLRSKCLDLWTNLQSTKKYV